jgi:acetoacetyl-CoA synthetase
MQFPAIRDQNRKDGVYANMQQQTFRELYEWSVGDKRTDFWEDMWNASGFIYDGEYTKVR